VAEGLEQAGQRVEHDPRAHARRHLGQRDEAGARQVEDPQQLGGEELEVLEPDAISAAGYAAPKASSSVDATTSGSHSSAGVGATPVHDHHQREEQEARRERERLGNARPRAGSACGRKRMFSTIGSRTPIADSALEKREQHELERDDGAGDREPDRLARPVEDPPCAAACTRRRARTGRSAT
jgi:hypothetical protein